MNLKMPIEQQTRAVCVKMESNLTPVIQVNHKHILFFYMHRKCGHLKLIPWLGLKIPKCGFLDGC